jgi:hypothetical protein
MDVQAQTNRQVHCIECSYTVYLSLPTSIFSPKWATEDVYLIFPLEDSNRNLLVHPNIDAGLDIIVQHLDHLVPRFFPSKFLIAFTFLRSLLVYN